MMDFIHNIIKARWFQFALIPAIVLVWFFFTDPSSGADTILRIQLWSQAFLVTGIAYLISKALLGKASSEALYDGAINGNVGAAIAYAGVCLMRAVILLGFLMFYSQVSK